MTEIESPWIPEYHSSIERSTVSVLPNNGKGESALTITELQVASPHLTALARLE